MGGVRVGIGDDSLGVSEYIGPMFGTWRDKAIRWIPSTCVVCHAWPSNRICEHCVQDFAQPVHRCSRCALALADGEVVCASCAHHPPVWDCALTAVDYAFPWSRLVTDFKFRENPAWARHFATLMRSTPWIEPSLESADHVIPMPLATERFKQRGFNQAALLSRQLCPAKNCEGILLRVLNTPAQHTLDRKDRQANVMRAYALEPQHATRVANKRIVLIDDVMTSGASMAAASAVLKLAGAHHITVMVFARTPRAADLA